MKWGSAALDANLDGNDSPALEDKLREANRQLVQAFNQNEKLVNALYEAREQITALKEEVDKLCAPPSTYGVYLAANEDHTVTILLSPNYPALVARPEGPSLR